MLNTSFINLPNVSFIQSTIPNLQTQNELLKNRFDREEGYNFEFLPLPELNIRNRIKFANKFNLENRNYSKEELNEIYSALINGLVEGVIREADNRNVKGGKYTYTIESLIVPYGGDVYDSSGYIIYVPPKDNIELPYLLSIVNVIFN